jgi:DnaA-homolog protein
MPAQQLALGLLRPRLQALDNFVAGGNGPALAALQDMTQGRGPQFLYLWGPPGCGRTHLLTALGASAAVPAYRGPGGLYAVDDVHRLGESDQSRLFVLLNEVRSDPAARLVATGDAPPARLSLREDVRTRLAWGLALSLQVLSEQDKADALRAQAAQRGVRLSADLIPYMLAHLPRDMRTLCAALEGLDAYALQQRRALTVPLLRQWLQFDDSRMSDA